MRISTPTMRRSYLRNYERARSAKFESEFKIQSNRQYVRASQDPIKAARAMRVRQSMSDINTYQTNLNSAHEIYTMAESSMNKVSEQIQLVYEKLVEGAHGTRNDNDLKIIAMDVEQKAEQMVSLLNVETASRKIFGCTNNETLAFEIKGDAETGRYVTYNGIPVNASSDPLSFPYSEMSYLDIGIGMTLGEKDVRVDGQTALPITFNGAQATGCGVTTRTVKIDLEEIVPGDHYELDVSVGSIKKKVEFNGGDNIQQTIDNINEALKEQFQLTPELDDDGNMLYLENREDYEETEILNYDNAFINNNQVDIRNMDPNYYYSLTITSNGKTRVIDFKGGEDVNETLDNIRTELKDKFGEDAPEVYSEGVFFDSEGNRAEVVNTSNYAKDVPISGDNIDLTKLEAGTDYSINVNGKKISFTAGATPQENKEAINKALSSGNAFGPSNVPSIKESSGIITLSQQNTDDVIYVANSQDAENEVQYSESGGYPNNIMQIVLDACKLLREGDQDMVARYADLLYASQSHLSIAVAELGTNDQFIEFNLDRTNNILLNLSDQQNNLEFTDLPSEITNWKLLESIYNATLQMGASIIPMSVFNYIQ